MSLVSRVGQNKGRGLLIILAFYAILAVGGITMVIPFLMTLSLSVTNQYDSTQYNIVPKFLYDRNSLFCKYLFYKYGANYTLIHNLYQIRNAEMMTDFVKLKDPAATHFGRKEYDGWEPDRLERAWQDWEEYWNSFRKTGETRAMSKIGVLYTSTVTPRFQEFLRKKYVNLWRDQNPELAATFTQKQQEEAALGLMNSLYGKTVATAWHRVPLTWGSTDMGRVALPSADTRARDYDEFLRTLSAKDVIIHPEDMAYGSSDFEFMAAMKAKHFTLKRLNEAWGTDFNHWGEVLFTEQAPANKAMAADWEEFVRTRMALSSLTVLDPLPTVAFRAHLRKKFGTVAVMNKALKTNYSSFDAVEFTPTIPQDKMLRLEWAAMLAQLPLSQLRVQRPDADFRLWLADKYGTVEKLNEAYGRNYASFADYRLPWAAFDWADFLDRQGSLRWFFLTHNFAEVTKFVTTQGNAMLNTLIYVFAVLVAGLTVNPLAAYALSRYKIKFKQLILLVFLIPMSFPGEVMQIPTFILTRDLGLLNTYWALILPGLANGFGIFLMKGFFDGLPKELYEACELDGANEWQIYWNVTFPMCKPIIALGMLGSIIAAYSDYMFALIVCPDERKWTLAVWIFQYSMEAGARNEAHLQMAALVLMSVPTLLIFIYMQRIIMKGIILPSMK